MIPIYQPYFTKKNLDYAHKAIDSGWVSSQGEYLDLTKNKLKEILQCKKLILNSGNVAMWICLYRGNAEGVNQYLNPIKLK